MTKPSLRSTAALNASNFFLAATVTIVAPFVADYLESCGYSGKTIGIAVAMPGLGVLCSMIPVGVWIDHTTQRRRLLAIAALVVGAVFACIPHVAATPWLVHGIMFVSGLLESFFTPLLFALALALAGPRGANRLVGTNQAWNHAGSIFAALAAAKLAHGGDTSVVFYTLLAYAVAAAASTMLIDHDELGEPPRGKRVALSADKLWDVVRDRRVVILLVCVMLFHFANQPILPLVVVHLNKQHHEANAISTLVLIAQGTMVVVAYLAGRLSDTLGRKTVMGAAFVVLPVRIALDALATQHWQFLGIQVLDGVDAGIYNVAVAAICADLAQKRGRFNALVGIVTTALAVGTMLGPLLGGYLLDHIGYRNTLLCLASVAATACVVFVTSMKETASPS